MDERFTVTANGSHEVSFPARNIFISNNTGAWVYVKIGSQQIPDVNSNDLAVPPFTQQSKPISPAARFFGFSIGSAFLPTASAQGGNVSVTFDSDPREPTVTNIAQTGIGFSPSYLPLNQSFAAGSNLILASPGATKRYQVFKLIMGFSNADVPNVFYLANNTALNTSTVFFQISGTQSNFIPESNWGEKGIPWSTNGAIYLLNNESHSVTAFFGLQYSVV